MNKRTIVRILKVVNKVEDWLLISMLSLMVGLAVLQIFYRNFSGGGIAWIDPLLRMLVLWVALSGAVIATRTDNHIRIDFFAKALSRRYYLLVQRLVYLYCAIICGFIAWHAVRFVQMDYEYGTEAFAGIPAWTTEVIIPIAFGLMAFRYCLLIVLPPRKVRQ